MNPNDEAAAQAAAQSTTNDTPNNPFAPEAGASQMSAVSDTGAESRDMHASQMLAHEQSVIDSLIDDDGGGEAADDAFASTDFSQAGAIEIAAAARRILTAVQENRSLFEGDASFVNVLLQSGTHPEQIAAQLIEVYTTEAAVRDALATFLIEQAHRATMALGSRFAEAYASSQPPPVDASPRLPVAPPELRGSGPPPAEPPPPSYEDLPSIFQRNYRVYA